MNAIASSSIVACLLTIGAMDLAQAQVATQRPASADRTSVLVLGTFHFRDAGLDDYKPRFSIDVLSEQRQREIDDLLQRLARFQPTIIAVEWREERQAALDSAYDAFRSGSRPATANERDQIGFRLAQRLGHDRVRAIDAAARWYDLAMNSDTLAARAQRFGQTGLMPRAMAWDRWYEVRSEYQDSIKTTMPLRDYLLQLNSEASMQEILGQYLNGSVEVGGHGDYSGADMRSAWYNRNLRIFTNLLRLQSEGEERILVVIGAGHAPLLRHFIANAPEMRLVEAATFLR